MTHPAGSNLDARTSPPTHTQNYETMADDSNRNVPTIPRARGSIAVPIPVAKTMVSDRFDVLHHKIPE
jgi:hypothetical protein